MIDRGTQKTLEEIRKYDVYYADEWEDMQSAEHKQMLDDALQYYEDVFNPGKGANWKWRNKYKQLELYDWNFASEHKHEIAEWLEGHGYKCTCQFGGYGIGYGTIYLNKPLEEHLRTLFTLTWS